MLFMTYIIRPQFELQTHGSIVRSSFFSVSSVKCTRAPGENVGPFFPDRTAMTSFEKEYTTTKFHLIFPLLMVMRGGDLFMPASLFRSVLGFAWKLQKLTWRRWKKWTWGATKRVNVWRMGKFEQKCSKLWLCKPASVWVTRYATSLRYP